MKNGPWRAPSVRLALHMGTSSYGGATSSPVVGVPDVSSGMSDVEAESGSELGVTAGSPAVPPLVCGLGDLVAGGCALGCSDGVVGGVGGVSFAAGVLG